MPLMKKSLQMFRYGWVKAMLLINFIAWAVSIAVQFAYILNNLSKENWTQYGPMFIAPLMLLFTQVVVLLSFNNFKIILLFAKSNLSWNLINMPPVVNQNIRKICKMGDVLLVVIFAGLGTASVLLSYDVNNHYTELFVIADYLEHNLPFLWTLSIWFTRMGTVSGYFIVVHTPLYTYYSVILLKIQVLILSGLIKNFEEDLKVQGTKPHFIKNRMVTIVRKHQDILRFDKLIHDEMYIAHNFMVLASLMSILFTLQIIFSDQFSLHSTFESIMVMLFLVGFFSHEAQSVQDMVEHLCLQMYNLEWYNWDLANMKMLRLFLLNASRRMSFNLITPNEGFGHLHFSKFIKCCYTVGSVFSSMLYQKQVR